MAKSKRMLKRFKYFRSLIIISVFLTLVLFYRNIKTNSDSESRENISSNSNEFRNEELSKPIPAPAIPELLPENNDVKSIAINGLEKDGQSGPEIQAPLPPVVLPSQEHVIKEISKNLDLPEDHLALIIDSENDPDPGEQLDPDNKQVDEELEANDSPLGEIDDFKRDSKFQESSLKLQREMIATKFSSMKTADHEINIKSLQISEGGKPIRNLIFATWGSGSNFIGDAVASHPLTFYHYEPFMNKGMVQIRPEPLSEAQNATNMIKSLLNCDYSQVDDLVSYFKNNQDVHSKNTMLWKFCQESRESCLDDGFLSKMCKLFPYQSMKFARLRLKLAEPLLADEQIDVRVFHLVRDPRGILYSRKDDPLCKKSPACNDPAKLCSDMVEDYHTAKELQEKYADTFMVLRYEDISLAVQHGFEVLLHHFRLQLTPEIQSYLNLHNVKSGDLASSAFHDSESVPFAWIDLLTNSKVGLEGLAKIEAICQEAMYLWGYARIPNTTVVGKFNPVLEPPWSEMRLI